MRWLAAVMLCGVVSLAEAQSAAVPAWQSKAGGRMSFEVASIKPDDGPFKTPSFALSPDDWFTDPKGRFHADFALGTYIRFAYKLWLTDEEGRALLAKLPDWVRSQRLEIQATAPLNLTKDQYRLMMQSLLADRFGLKLHFEQKDLPVLEMTLAKPGMTGPHLTPHEKGEPCDAAPSPKIFPPFCYGYSARPLEGDLWVNASRATTMDLLASFIGMTGQMQGETDRRVVNSTGLDGLWDFTLELPPPQSMRKDPAFTGPTFLEALREQLGLKLKPGRATVSLPVIDLIETLKEN